MGKRKWTTNERGTNTVGVGTPKKTDEEIKNKKE